MPRRIVACLGLAMATASSAETAGPPVPLTARRSPAEQAAALYRAEHPVAGQADDCATPRRGEIVVCGSDRSPYRLPLPAERGAPSGARIATGERDRVVDAGSPMPGPRGVGLQFKLPLGKASAAATPTLRGLGDDN